MVNPVGKVAVATGLAAVGLHKAYGDMKRERERRAAAAEHEREQASQKDFVEEMARASQASAAEREAQRQRSDHNRESIAELFELRVSLMGRALRDLRRGLAADFVRESPPLSGVGLPLVGREDSVDFAIAAVLLAWGEDELLERFWPGRRRGDEDGEALGSDFDAVEGVDNVEAYRVGFCVQRCSPRTLRVVRSWLARMAKFGPAAGEWTVPLPNRVEAERSFGEDNQLFGLSSGPPLFNRVGGNEDQDMTLDHVALSTFLGNSKYYRVVDVNIRSEDHFRAVSCLGHLDVVFATGLGVSQVNRQRDGGSSARYVTPDSVGRWRGPGTYIAANFPLRKTKPRASAGGCNNRNASNRGKEQQQQQAGAGYCIGRVEQEEKGRVLRWSAGDARPFTKWLPSEVAWRKASAKEAFAQSMLSREAAALLGVLTPQRCDGAGLWHFLALSGEPQRYAMSMLGFLEARDAALLGEAGGTGKGKEVAGVLAAALRRVVPPPAVREGGTPREAMKALDIEIDTFVHGCYLELLRSLYSVPMENLLGHTPADVVGSSMHHRLWSKVLMGLPNRPKLLQVALREVETEKREAAHAASRGGTPAWWTALMAAAVSAAVAVLFVSTYERQLSTRLFFALGGGRLPGWVADRVSFVLGWDNLTAPVFVLLFFEVFLKYCRPPARSTPEKEDGSGGSGGSGYDEGGRSRLGTAVLWRIEAASEISRVLYRAVALAAGLPPPGQRSREELMLKCKEWLRIWGLRQLHSNMASAARRGRITKSAAKQIADGIFLYRAEEEAAAVRGAAARGAGAGAGSRGLSGGADASFGEAGTLPGSAEEAEAFLNLPVVEGEEDADSADGGAEDWSETPLPGSAVEGALNMAMFGATAEEVAGSVGRLVMETRGAENGGGGQDSDGSGDSDSDSDSDDDDDDRSRVEQERTLRRRRSKPTEERSYQAPGGAEAARGCRSRSDGVDGRSDGVDGAGSKKDGGVAGGGAEGVKDTVRRLLARRGWTFEKGAAGVAYARQKPKNASARARLREKFVDSKTFWHDSVGVGAQWIDSVTAMMAVQSHQKMLASMLRSMSSGAAALESGAGGSTTPSGP